MLNVVCINAGNYQGRGVEYVNNLYRMVQKHLTVPHRFVCFTDQILGEDVPVEYDAWIILERLPDPSFKRWWHKISLFKPGLFPEGDRIIYFDLSTVIMGNIDDLGAYSGPFCMTGPFGGDGPYGGLQSNVMAWEAGFGEFIYASYMAKDCPDFPGGDQAWIEKYSKHVSISTGLEGPVTWNEICPGKIKSYKWDLMGNWDGRASVICFHGKPKPHELGGWAYEAWSGTKTEYQLSPETQKQSTFDDSSRWRNLPATNFQITHWNEGASMPLIIPIQADCNTSDEALAENIRVNSRTTDKWVQMAEAHSQVAIICGSGPSLADNLSEVRKHIEAGATLFALNGAAAYLHDHDLMPDYQVILDAREETSSLVGPARERLFASQVHPATLAKAPDAWLYHCEIGGTDNLLPRQEGYVLLHGSASVGNTALPLVYALGYRCIHLYGYDSSHKGAESHPFPQPMNAGEPCAYVTFNGKQYLTSFVMKMQAERFQSLARQLQDMDCEIYVHGYGLLPDMWNAEVEELTELDKYERIWAYPHYRAYSPGENAVDEFIKLVNPEPGSRILDFGSGTGRASLRLKEKDFDPVMLDFAANCRDPEAYSLPFFRIDLTQEIPIRGTYGFCADVLEHIPPEDVQQVIANIMAAAKTVYFQVSTIPDRAGALINQPLHLTVEPHKWWLELFQENYRVEFDREGDIASQFILTRKDY